MKDREPNGNGKRRGSQNAWPNESTANYAPLPMGDTLRRIKGGSNGLVERRPDRKRLLASLPREQDSSMPRDFLQPTADPLLLYPFRFRDPVTGKWVRARYKAERTEIAARYAEWEICGSPEIRRRGGGVFTPWRRGS